MSAEPDLSFIRIDVDAEKVEPIDLKKLIVTVNEFLLRSCDILNNFSVKMEESVIELESRIDRVETELILLENRLENIPAHGAQSSSSKESPKSMPIVEERKKENLDKENGPKLETVQMVLAEPAHETIETIETKSREEPTLKIKDHPFYANYFKMLRLGVPEPAVRQKMLTDGVDPSLLSTPDAPAPSIPTQKPRRSSDSDDHHTDSSYSDAD